jgi:ClpP class serine protease
MKNQFISRLACKPWNMDKIRARNILGGMIVKLLRNERPGEDIFGGALPKMQIVGDVALIPLNGVIDMNVPDWIKEWGFNLTDANDIEEEIDEALANPNVELIVFDVDSPGGSDLAGRKLFALVEAARKKKRVFAYCGDGREMASTAYYAVASALGILAGYYAEAIGCIGSYLVVLDDSKFWEKLGVSIEVFRSGALKAIGEDSLSVDQKDYLQSRVDDCGNTFRKQIVKYRDGIDEADMQGQWFSGIDAAKHGFVAGNVKSLDAAIAKFRTAF